MLGPNLSLAMNRSARHFDGNGQKHIRVWHWAYVDRFEPEDYEMMLSSLTLDWVIVPLPEPA